MAAAEGITQIHLVALVREICAHRAQRPSLTDILAHREVNSAVARQMTGAIAIQKS
jgi:hypothetical protein